MKYYTKEFFQNYWNIPETNFEMGKKYYEDVIKQYSEYYKTIKPLLHPELIKALCLHDNMVVAISFNKEIDNDDYIIYFDPERALSNTCKLVFKNPVVIKDEDITAFTDYAIHEELYLVDGKYELHLLFRRYTDDDLPRLVELIIQADDILYEIWFRNVGQCNNCGKLVEDPGMPRRTKRPLNPGQFIGGEWYCNECLK